MTNELHEIPYCGRITLRRFGGLNDMFTSLWLTKAGVSTELGSLLSILSYPRRISSGLRERLARHTIRSHTGPEYC